MRKTINRNRSLRPSNLLNTQRDTRIVKQSNLFSNRLDSALTANPTAEICIIRKVGGIGDVLMVTPALRELKLRHPKIKLTFAVDRHSTRGDIYYELVKNASFIDEVIDARYVDRSLYQECVDVSSVCIPYERKGLPSRNRISLFANHMGLQRVSDPLPFYETTPEEDIYAKEYLNLKFKTGRPIIALHTASNEEKRCWTVPQMVSFIRYMQKEIPGVQFLILDQNIVYLNWKDLPEVEVLHTSTIREMSALIKHCDMFVGPDSGPMHIAGALKKKSVVVFGSIPPEARINFYKNHVSVRMDELKCIGCWYAACPYNIKCMKDLEGVRVGKVAKEHLRRSIK